MNYDKIFQSVSPHCSRVVKVPPEKWDSTRTQCYVEARKTPCPYDGFKYSVKTRSKTRTLIVSVEPTSDDVPKTFGTFIQAVKSGGYSDDMLSFTNSYGYITDGVFTAWVSFDKKGVVSEVHGATMVVPFHNVVEASWQELSDA